MSAILNGPVKLSESLYLLSGGYPHPSFANVYLLLGKEPTLIDCGQEADVPLIIRNLEMLGFRIKDVVKVIATHGHFDHVDAIHELSKMHLGLELWMHPLDWKMVVDGDDYRTAASLYQKQFRPIAAKPGFTLEHDDTILAGDTTWRVIHTPGHSEGSICLYGALDGKQVLIAGDTYRGGMLGIDDGCLTWCQTIDAWRSSLEVLQQLPFEVIYNGHQSVEEMQADALIVRRKFEMYVHNFGKMFSTVFESYSLPEAGQKEIPIQIEELQTSVKV